MTNDHHAQLLHTFIIFTHDYIYPRARSFSKLSLWESESTRRASSITGRSARRTGRTRRGMRFAHITENYLEDPRQDPNCMMPLSALRQLESEGRIGELAGNALSCMGGIYSQRRVREELAPALVERCVRDEIEAVLLVPV